MDLSLHRLPLLPLSFRPARASHSFSVPATLSFPWHILLLLAAFWIVAPVCRAQSVHTLHSFGDGTDAAQPRCTLVAASDGYFYGTTYQGGPQGYGTIFKIRPDGGGYAVLHNFDGNDGAYPSCSLVQASDSKLYGTTSVGGQYGYGSIFSVDLSGNVNAVHHFNKTDGAYPLGGLVQASDGNLYGTTSSGGSKNYGTVYRYTLAGVLSTAHTFNNADGNNPQGELLAALDGRLYGITIRGGMSGYGTIYRLSTSLTLTTIHHFNSVDGNNPNGGLVQASNGKLYGTANGGGRNESYGCVYCLNTNGTEFTDLHDFDSAAGNPLGGLIAARDGNLYGSTYYGGKADLGTLFRMTPTGSIGALYTFKDDGGGAYPDGQLTQTADGEIYGVTSAGGFYGYGTVYHLSLPVAAINSLSPNATEAGHKAFTLTVNGSGFMDAATVYWNDQPLTTTFVSGTQVKAKVPASLVSQAGQATITVKNGSGNVSNGVTFIVHLTVLKLTYAHVTKDADGNYVAHFRLKNVGNHTAPNTHLIQAALGSAATTTPLPLMLGDVGPGAVVSGTLLFPPSAGPSGAVVTLAERCSFTGATTASILKIDSPLP